MSGIETVNTLLKSILSEINYYNGSKVDIKLVNSGGANYTSELYEITVTHEHKDALHLFAKVAIMNENIRKDLALGGATTVFEIEDKVYRKIQTAFNEIQDKHGIPKDERFIFSKFFGSSLEVGNETFIFENLNLKGYQIYDRFEPLDHQCMFDTIAALANFHALGLTLERERPEIYKEFECVEISLSYDKFVDSSYDHIQNIITTLDEQHREKLQKFIKDGGINIYKKIFAHKGRFLIHGDYRGSNILYKKEGGKVIVVPVDYQCVRVGCPITDLLYFITLSTDETFRINHFEELIEHYYKQLTLYSSKLGVDINVVYPRQMFQDEFKELLPATLLMALSMFPLIMVEPDEAPIVSDEKMELSNFFVKPNEKSTERLTGYIRDCERWGII